MVLQATVFSSGVLTCILFQFLVFGERVLFPPTTCDIFFTFSTPDCLGMTDQCNSAIHFDLPVLRPWRLSAATQTVYVGPMASGLTLCGLSRSAPQFAHSRAAIKSVSVPCRFRPFNNSIICISKRLAQVKSRYPPAIVASKSTLASTTSCIRIASRHFHMKPRLLLKIGHFSAFKN